MEIWCNMLYHNVGINKKDSDYIISTKNRWNNIYQNDYYNTIIHNNIEIHNFVYSLFKENEPLPNEKMKSWFDFINNPFYSASSKEYMWNIFNKTQKMSHVFVKFINMCKIKKMKVKVDCDLNMNKITIRPQLSLEIIQNSKMKLLRFDFQVIPFIKFYRLIHTSNNQPIFAFLFTDFIFVSHIIRSLNVKKLIL